MNHYCFNQHKTKTCRAKAALSAYGAAAAEILDVMKKLDELMQNRTDLQGLEANGFEEVEYLLADGYVRLMVGKRAGDTDTAKAAESFFKPKKKDLVALADLLAENECYSVLDVGCGSGRFILSLCAHITHQVRSKFSRPVQFKGIDTRFWNYPVPPNDFPNCKFELNGIEAMARAADRSKTEAVDDTSKRKKDIKVMDDTKFDAVFCIWMPQNSDWREQLCKLSNKLVILVLSQDFNTGTVDAYSGCKAFGFELIKSWDSGGSTIQVHKRKVSVQHV